MDPKQREMQRLKETGKISTSVGAKEIGRILDHHNSLIDKEADRKLDREITAMNKYYWKLFLWSLNHPGEDYKNENSFIFYHKEDKDGSTSSEV